MSDSEDSTVTYTEDDVLPLEEQPMSAAVSPTAISPCYITNSNPEEDMEEDDEDPEEDPADYPTDRNDVEEDEESSGDDTDDEEEDEYEDKEEEQLAPTDSVPPPTCRTTARMSIRDQTPIPFLSAAEVERFLAISTPPPSPLTSYSTSTIAMIRLRAESPSTSHPLPIPSPIVLPHTRASVAMMRAVVPSTYILASRSETPPSGISPLLPIPFPTPSPPLLLPSTDCRAGVSSVTLPPWKRLCITLGLRFEVGESLSAPNATPTGGFRVDYGFIGTLNDEIRQDTDKIYRRLDDAQDDRSLMNGQLNMLRRDRRAYARTARLMQSEERLSHEAWTEIEELGAADRRRQTQLTKALTLLRRLQTHMAVLQSQQTPTREPAYPEIPEEAGSSS
ncbi:hypothetical protein Tco_0256016 [Tanacetum coccineum]